MNYHSKIQNIATREAQKAERGQLMITKAREPLVGRIYDMPTREEQKAERRLLMITKAREPLVGRI